MSKTAASAPDQDPLPALLARLNAAVNAGEFEAARALCEEVFTHAPGSLAAMWHYITITKIAKGDAVLGRVVAALQAGGHPPALESQLRFMLGKAQDDMGQTGAAFKQFVRANDLKGCSYDAKNSAALASALIKRAGALPDVALAPKGPRMVFVLGMPRSGTSLLSQMLAAHPDVENLGEMTALAPALTDQGNGPRPLLDMMENLTEARLMAARDAYIAAIPADKRRSDKILVDKMPENYWLAWAIPRMFPDALVIHIRRNRLATCWSCYRNDFREGHSYATDFRHLLSHWNQHLRLMDAFQKTAPGAFVRLTLDQVTGDPEGVLTPVLTRLGLPWDAACAAPEKAGGDMATLSKWQVRQGIDPKIAKGWRAYLPMIEEKWGVSA